MRSLTNSGRQATVYLARGMTIFKIEKRKDPFARIDNRTLRDERLSWKATGLLACLLSLPPDWHITLQHLCNAKSDGLHATQSALKELERYAYAKFERPRDRCGRFGGSVWRIFERPFADKQVFPLSGNSDGRKNPASGKIRFSEKSATTNEIASNLSTNKRTSTKLLAPDGERNLLVQLSDILGPAEMKKNGGMWRGRIRGGPSERRALRNTIEDFKLRTPDERQQIRKPAAWFTDRYMRNLVEVSAARNSEGSCGVTQ